MDQSDRGIFSVEVPCSYMTLAYIKFTKPSQHTSLAFTQTARIMFKIVASYLLWHVCMYVCVCGRRWDEKKVPL